MTAARTVHFVTDHIRIDGLAAWADGFVRRLRSQGTEEIGVADAPDEATWVVFLGSGILRRGWYAADHLRRHPTYRRHGGKCFVWCTDDAPLTFAPGLYASMPLRSFDRRLHRAYTYYELPNETTPVPDRPRDLLYSFVGGPTADVRRRLVAGPHPADARVEQTPNFNHGRPLSAIDRTLYADTLARSRFALCPRGVGTSSYRLFEAMRFGCVPVILSDDFVEPDGPDWGTFAVRVAESDVDRLPDLLARSAANAAAMGHAAQVVYHRYFAPDVRLANVARLLSSLGPHGSTDGRVAFHRQQCADLVRRAGRRVARAWQRAAR